MSLGRANGATPEAEHTVVAGALAHARDSDIQLELIQQRNDAPSAFKEFLDVAYWTDDFQSLYDKALSLGYTVTQEGSIGGEHGRFAYLDTEHDHGTAIQISDSSGPKGPFFSDIRDAPRTGTAPIRSGDADEHRIKPHRFPGPHTHH